MSRTISVNISSNKKTTYDILMGANLLRGLSWLPKKTINHIVIITDNNVKKSYGEKLHRALKKRGFRCLLLSFSAGEKSKNYHTKQRIENAMLKNRCDRDTLIIALGGGVVGDMAGFIAATYLRGVSYIQVPTTLLAMVDSSIGGKTGINTAQGKNLIGAIYQPNKVITDVAFLSSLPHKHKINGLIEAIKMFLTHDGDSFLYTDKYLKHILADNNKKIKHIVERAISIKAGVVARDERESGERSLLNFGHTIGHALEKITNYKLLHGYAVAYGILVEINISLLMGFLDYSNVNAIKKLLSKLGIHGSHLKKYDINKLILATRNDKKSHLNQVNYVLLENIGSAYIKKGQYIHAVPDNIVKQAFKSTFAEV